ncbi:hypothetical protein T12_6141 [Trichinella patagoniensis]|uniref:Uncharacterized protein n=1 Tax=Trichinella patagoniensis TaxID=990121 RepID=A0A0V1AGN1_9BILA|nr:hypothetical protein T12_6141 [Trichinella patagoniensis]
MCECQIPAKTCHFYSYRPPMPYNCLKAARDITDLKIIARSRWTVRRIFLKKHCDYSIYFMHYMFVYILRDFYAALDCASMKADILHFQTRPDQAPGIAGPVPPISLAF